MGKKYVYLFTEGNGSMRELLGGKGANLAEMTNLGMPVPQGFTITTEACTQYYVDGEKINDEIRAEIKDILNDLGSIDQDETKTREKIKLNIAKIKDMVFKEDNILMPMLLEHMTFLYDLIQEETQWSRSRIRRTTTRP